MKCIHCSGNMKKSSAPFYIEKKGYRIHWNTVPAWVCEQCGEPYFEEKEVDKIQNVLTILDAEKSLIS